MSDQRRQPREALMDTILRIHPRLNQAPFQVDARVWAIHGYIPVDGEVILAEFDDRESASAMLQTLALADARSDALAADAEVQHQQI